MSPAVKPAGPRYRNDAVFRSAERLIATAAARRPIHRWRHLGLFLASLFGGLGAALLWWQLRPTPRETPQPQSPPVFAGGEVGGVTSSDSRADAPSPSTAAPATAQPAEPMAGAIPAARAPALPATLTTPPAPAVAPDTPGAPDAASAVRPKPWNEIWISAFRAIVAFQLEGEARLASGEVHRLEFELHLKRENDLGVLFGVVRPIGGAVFNQPIPVMGLWLRDHLSLAETAAGSGGPVTMPLGHTFLLAPPESDESEFFTGTWDHGGIRIATLTAKLVARP